MKEHIDEQFHPAYDDLVENGYLTPVHKLSSKAMEVLGYEWEKTFQIWRVREELPE